MPIHLMTDLTDFIWRYLNLCLFPMMMFGQSRVQSLTQETCLHVSKNIPMSYNTTRHSHSLGRYQGWIQDFLRGFQNFLRKSAAPGHPQTVRHPVKIRRVHAAPCQNKKGACQYLCKDKGYTPGAGGTYLQIHFCIFLKSSKGVYRF